MEGEVLEVLGEPDGPHNKLGKRVYEQSKVTSRRSRHCQHPQLHAVVELPTVDVLKGVLCLGKMSNVILNLPGCCG